LSFRQTPLLRLAGDSGNRREVLGMADEMTTGLSPMCAKG
jgi:hypothetical protein